MLERSSVFKSTTNTQHDGQKKTLKMLKRSSVIKSTTNRQHDGQKKKDKMINNDTPSITQITKDRETRIPLKVPVVTSGALEGLEVPAPHVTPVVLLGPYSTYNMLHTSARIYY